MVGAFFHEIGGEICKRSDFMPIFTEGGMRFLSKANRIIETVKNCFLHRTDL